MKYLGIDYGTKRVGIALSDDDGSFAFPKTVFDTIMAIQEIALLCQSEQVVAIVLGESVATNEVHNMVAVKTAAFKKKLEKVLSIPIYFEREDFSSVEAHRYQTKKGSRDDSAAAIILQRYLDKLLDTKKLPQ